jgi:hypothetical protein
MEVSVKTYKMLWGRAAGICSMPECRKKLVVDPTDSDDETLIGDSCHIVAQADNGPRGDASVPIEYRNSYPNLILLCRNHHKIIDSQENFYTVQKLKFMKKHHEDWIQASLLGFDKIAQNNDEIYASYVEEWEKLCRLNDWESWATPLINYYPGIDIGVDEDLHELELWLLNRIWPGRYERLENSFVNFQRILVDLRRIFHTFSERRGRAFLTRGFYKDRCGDEIPGALDRFYFHSDLVSDLILELTRSANLLCDEIRRSLMPTYRLKEGKIRIRNMGDLGLSVSIYVPEYFTREKESPMPYHDLERFMHERKSRDVNFGTGTLSEAVY